jgi:hypothetical protein
MSKPDYLYDPEDWEVTYDWGDRSEAVEHVDLGYGEIKRFNTLISGPPKFAALVVLTRDEAGDVDEHEIQWFDSEEEAKAAVTSGNRDAQ